jgi:hypothetical protein
LKEYPDPELWVDVIESINRSKFLTGKVAATGNRAKPWRCDFDWILNSTNLLKLIEGKYSE